MRCSILGFGWFGEPLGLKLQQGGHIINGSTRSEEKKNLLINKGLDAFVLTPPLRPTNLSLSDIVIVNIPPFESQLEWFKSWDWNGDQWPIFISSTSVIPNPETRSAEILKSEEEFFQNNFKRFTILRFGGLLGNGRHPGKYLSGRKDLAGQFSPVNLLHLEDAIKVTLMIIEKNLNHHIFNVVSSEHPTRKDYYTEYCRKNNLPLPHFNEEDQSKGKLISNEELLPYYSKFHPI